MSLLTPDNAFYLQICSTHHQPEKGQPGILKFMPARSSREVLSSPPLASKVRGQSRETTQQQQETTSPLPLAVRLRQQQASMQSFLRRETASSVSRLDNFIAIDDTRHDENALHIIELDLEEEEVHVSGIDVSEN
jgi:hypothetical protein